jgi:hypothetical protein
MSDPLGLVDQFIEGIPLQKKEGKGKSPSEDFLSGVFHDLTSALGIGAKKDDPVNGSPSTAKAPTPEGQTAGPAPDKVAAPPASPLPEVKGGAAPPEMSVSQVDDPAGASMAAAKDGFLERMLKVLMGGGGK